MNIKRKRLFLFLFMILISFQLLVGCSSDTSNVEKPITGVESINNNIDNVTDDIKELDKNINNYNNKIENLDKIKKIEEEVEKDRYNEKVDEITNSKNSSNGKKLESINTVFESHYIDVGQADSILLINNGKTLLIDAGEKKNGLEVVNYIKNLGYNRLDYIIGTHPHADHIGGMADVINNLEVGEIFLPNKPHTTKVYENMLLAIKNNKVKLTNPDIGDTRSLGDANITFLSPGKNDIQDNLNNYSIVIRVDHGNNSFLYTGDAEKEVESQLLQSGLDLKANVLKVGHHGSTTSSTNAFIKAVNPDISVITVGSNNKYGHPHGEILSRLQSTSKVLRTDELGHIIIKSDGKKIIYNNKTVEKNNIISQEATNNSKQDNQSNVSSSNQKVWITKTGSKYHKEDCTYAQKSGQPVNLKEAEIKGLTPCKVCNP